MMMLQPCTAWQVRCWHLVDLSITKYPITQSQVTDARTIAYIGMGMGTMRLVWAQPRMSMGDVSLGQSDSMGT